MKIVADENIPYVRELFAPLGDIVLRAGRTITREDVATQTAISLKADKLIAFTKNEGLLDQTNKLIRSCGLSTVKRLLIDEQNFIERLLMQAIASSAENGVERCHCVSYQSDSALLQELFTRDGAGTLVAKDHKEHKEGENSIGNYRKVTEKPEAITDEN